MKDQALKDISSFKDLASSVLASSPLWNLPARRIKPQQLASFKQRLKFEGYKDIDFLFHKIMLSLNQAKRSGELKNAPILTYTEPSHKVLTSTDLINGFDQMSRPSPAAILFALEVGMSAEQVISLTWKHVGQAFQNGGLTATAREILVMQPRHIKSHYVFWRERNGKPEPLFGLELEVFGCFDMVWAELKNSYRTLVNDC